MGRTTEQLEMAWANIKWNPTAESIEEFLSKIKQLATVLGKTQEDQVLKIKMSSPSAEVYRLIMQYTTIENIINLINQMQAMNFQSVQPSMPYTAVPFMAAQVDAQKQVTFSFPLDHKVEKMTDKLDMLTENMDKLAVSMNDLRQRPRDGRDSSRNRNRSWSRGRDQYRSDSGQRYRNRSDSRNRSWSRGRDRRDRSYDRQYRGRYRSRDIIEILEAKGIETLDQTEVINQEATIERGTMVTITEGLTIVLDAAVIKVAIIIRDLGIEVTLMAEETQEEILHVLMIVYSPCRTP